MNLIPPTPAIRIADLEYIYIYLFIYIYIYIFQLTNNSRSVQISEPLWP